MFVFSFLARTGMAQQQCDKLPVYAAVFSTDPGIPGPVNWNFGDGSTGTGNPVTHIYTANATYTVTASYTWSGGTYTCSVPVAVTGCQMACCDADFTASVYRDCGALMLSLTSECSDGDHDWTVATVPAAQCMTLIGYGQAFVHDHNPNSATGAGIFMNCNVPTATTAGINLNSAFTANNLIACNRVTSTVAGVRNLIVSASADNTIVRNHLTGPSTGAEFRLNCGTITQFRCNTMDNNQGNGLRYVVFAQTGDQGVPFVSTHGNQWVGAFTPNAAAFADGTVLVGSSRYFVRTTPTIENPLPNVTPLFGWFAANVPAGNTPDCLFDCPLEDPEAPPLKFLSSLDTLIAEETVQYDGYAEEQIWWNERYLYDKLFYHPALAIGNPTMQAFLDAKAETAMGRLVQMTGRIDSLFRLSNAQQNTLEANRQAVEGLLTELSLIDSLLGDSLAQTQALNDLLTQRAALLDELEAIHAINAGIQGDLDEQREEGIASLSATLAAITPDHTFEATEKEALRIFIATVVARAARDSAALESLLEISSLCVLEGGPAIYLARQLYSGFTGQTLPEVECWDAGQRAQPRNSNSLAPALQKGILLYPNPADDYLAIRLEEDLPVEDMPILVITNHLGQSVLQDDLYARDNLINIATLPNGSYQAKVLRNGELVFAKLLTIHR